MRCIVSHSAARLLSYTTPTGKTGSIVEANDTMMSPINLVLGFFFALASIFMGGSLLTTAQLVVVGVKNVARSMDRTSFLGGFVMNISSALDKIFGKIAEMIQLCSYESNSESQGQH